MRLTGSGFMVKGFISRLSLANHRDLGSFLVVLHCSAKMESSKEDSGRTCGLESPVSF